MEQNKYLDTSSTEWQEAFELIARTNVPFFLTGEAGTGKTTFLRFVRENVKKNFIVLAPTGIAALTAGGETIHSFFGFSLEAQGERPDYHMNKARINLVKKADTIIIDEVSMLRCDLTDAIDFVLRDLLHSRLPFGGKQVVFVGDMFQLPPVVKKQKDSADANLLKHLYGSTDAYFYKAHVFSRMNLPKIQFIKVHRQKDEDFRRILNNVRYGIIRDEDLRRLNEHVTPKALEASEDYSITVSPYNRSVERINDERLNALEGESVTYEGVVDGEFVNEFPTPKELTLKVGAQIMFCMNDIPMHRWVNGTIGIVTKLGEKTIRVKLSSEKEFDVLPVSWEHYKQYYNPDLKRIDKELVGSYTQLPVKLAWAVTVHKSQGLTFSKLNIDLEKRMSIPGQFYVALSRITALDGLTLTAPVLRDQINVNTDAVVFSKNYNNQQQIQDELESGKALYPFIRKEDYDGAGKAALALVVKKMTQGQLRDAALMAKRMFDLIIFDDCMMGQTTDVPLLAEEGTTVQFLNAVLCLYGERYDEGIAYANSVLGQRVCPEALYIKARCLQMLSRFDEADSVNAMLISQLESKGDGLDLKCCALVAAVNEHIGDPVLGFLQKIVAERKSYIPAYLLIRRFLHANQIEVARIEVDDVDDKENELIILFNQSNVDDDAFAARLSDHLFDPQGKALRKQLQKIVI